MGTPGDKHSGIGMTSDRTRARMVERLRADGIRDEVVLSAMNAVPRHIFVDEALAIRAYDDAPLPIGNGQTISQPWVVARMTELARNGRALDTVLEIGTGCGYQTAVLAGVATTVYTVERIGALVAFEARRRQCGSRRRSRGRRDRRHRRGHTRSHPIAPISEARRSHGIAARESRRRRRAKAHRDRKRAERA
jgi:hypothetical protein